MPLSLNNRSVSTPLFRAAMVAAIFCLATFSAIAQTNVRVRVMASNLTGNSQFYGTPELDILKGLKADVVAIQEFQYSSTTSNGVNTPAAIREMVDNAFGTSFFYFREPYTANGDIPNGIISRYPILASGSWVDTQVGNRGFAWAQIDLPGTNNLYIVSVHLLTSSSGARATEASNLTTLIQANFPANAWIIVAGDFNTDTTNETAVTTFKTYLSDDPIPVDNNGNSNTSGPRSKPHDYVLPSFSMTNTLTSVVLPSNTFPSGLVFDSRVYTPLSDVPPVVSTDSANAQHMGVFRDFLVLDSLAPGTLLSVTPVGGLSSSGHTGGPFNPTSQIYSLANSGTSNMAWAATNTATWVTVSPTNGTLASGASTNVTVSINGTANGLSAGSYSDTVVFTNTTDGTGSTARSVSLTVNATAPEIVTNGYTLAAENCAPGNGVVDPGETVTVNLSLRNIGTAATTNLVATLLGTDDVSLPSDPQTYGIVPTNGTVSESFSFTAGGTCGGVITATLQLQDGAADLGTINFTIPLGVTPIVFTQNFDSITAPSLPAGWTTSTSGAQSNWLTSTASADTAPNAAFSSDTNSVGVNELDTPSIAINSGVAQLTFRQNYSLALSTTNSSLGYDGGVLEIAIGGGSYTDIVAAGGSFVSGGYNTTLSADYSNPLAGRQAWSGTSGGFVTTTVNLPAASAGQNVQLRWRCAAGNTPAPVTSSGTLAYWSFDQSSGIASTVVANVSATSVVNTNVSGVAPTFPSGNPGFAISSVNFVTSVGPPSTSYSCWSFALTITNGAQAVLSSLSFDDRASPTGPTKFSLHVSTASDFSSTIYTSVAQSTHSAFATTPMNTSTLNLSNLTGTIYFRIYGYQSGALTGTWRIDNLNVQGSVTSGGSTVGSGWYVDSVSIQDAFCCTNFVNSPVADFTGSPTAGAPPLMVTFNDASTGAITNWFWDFGDSNTTNVTTNSVVHTYAAAGAYDVILIATGPDGVSTNTKTGYITAWTPFQAWQILHFGSTSIPSAAAGADPDGDGMSNMQEFLAGTDPNDSSSALRITSIARENMDIRVTWTTGIGKTNALQFTTGAADGSFSSSFSDLFIVTNTTDTVTNYLDTGAATNAPTRYYRVLLVP